MPCCHHLEILNNFWMKNPVFSFFVRPHKLYSQSCLTREANDKTASWIRLSKARGEQIMRREAYLFNYLLHSTYHVPSPRHIFTHLILIILVLLTSPFYRRGNWGTEKLSSLPTVTQLVKPGFEPRQLGYRVWMPDHLGQCQLLFCNAASPTKKISSFCLLIECGGHALQSLPERPFLNSLNVSRMVRPEKLQVSTTTFPCS